MGRDINTEVLDRVVRIETRLMKYFKYAGFDGQGRRPEFVDGRLIAPSADCSLRDCLDVIPDDWDKPVEVFVGDDYLTTLD